MSPVDVSAMMKNLEQRTSAVEQILPTLATKEDLKALATKEDLKAFVTKEELKEALKPFATRAEMEGKFEEAKRFALVLHEDLKSDIALIAEHLADVMTRLPRRGNP
jgi:hypothetical protein